MKGHEKCVDGRREKKKMALISVTQKKKSKRTQKHALGHETANGDDCW